jgi:rRNA maturation endonuclease Nob1
VMTCSTCDREIPDNLDICPYCGRPTGPVQSD